MIKEQSSNVKRFLEHNRESPVVCAGWLDKNKREPKGSPDTWKWQKLELEDGTIYFLTDEESAQIKPKTIKWKGITND